MPHLPGYLHLLFFGMQMWLLPSLPHLYSSVFTFLRHICKEKICRKILFFRPAELFSITIIRTYKFGSIAQSGDLFALNSLTLLVY